jgi:formaldehyde-activating enzyme
MHEHYHRLSRATDLPIILYNIPQTVDAVIPRRVVEDLAVLDNVVAIKDSSGNVSYIIEILEKTRDQDFNVLVGYDEIVTPALVAGCSGMILASAQVYPDVWRKVFDTVRSGDPEKAMQVQMTVQKLSRIFCRYGGAVPVKAALRKMGIDVGRARKPLREGGVILPEDREEIFLELEKIGKIKGEKGESIKLPEKMDDRFVDLGLESSALGRDSGISVSQADAGDGIDRVKITVALGPKTSRLADVFAEQLTYPKQGYEALPAMLEPNLSVRPSALIIPTYKLENLRQANIIYGPGQAGIAKAIADNLAKENISKNLMETHIMLVRVTLDPDALDRATLYRNIYTATSRTIREIIERGAV